MFKRCGNCKFGSFDDEDHEGVCFFNPPVPFLIPTTSKLGQVGVKIISIRPGVQKDTDSCGKYVPEGCKVN